MELNTSECYEMSVVLKLLTVASTVAKLQFLEC